ncbi:MAG: alpha-L-fucosidase, partial [Candidatus Saccharimonadales bacterium]
MATGRRQFLEVSALCGLATVLHTESFANLAVGDLGTSKSELALPTFPQMEWQDCELGILFEFDISIASGNIYGDNNIRKTFNPQDYDPIKLDTDQWVETAKEAGAKYAIFTATHFGGFLQWQSDLYPYGLKQAKWKNGKGDLVADFILSCYKYDIKPGLYLSTHRNAYWQVDNHYVDWGHGKGTSKQREYNRICEKMTEELCSRYGRLLQIWYDAGVKTPAEGGPNVLPIFEKYQPNSIFYNSSQREDVRWIGNEGGYAAYPCWAMMPGSALPYNSLDWDKFIGSGAEEGSVWAPAMVDVPLRGARGVHSWFWQPNQENGVYSPQQLMKIYEQSVGRNSNMVIGPAIDPNGQIPEKDAQSLRGFGNILQ